MEIEKSLMDREKEKKQRMKTAETVPAHLAAQTAKVGLKRGKPIFILSLRHRPFIPFELRALISPARIYCWEMFNVVAEG